MVTLSDSHGTAGAAVAVSRLGSALAIAMTVLHEQLVDQHRHEAARVLAEVLQEVLGDHGCDGKAALYLHPGGGQSVGSSLKSGLAEARSGSQNMVVEIGHFCLRIVAPFHCCAKRLHDDGTTCRSRLRNGI